MHGGYQLDSNVNSSTPASSTASASHTDCLWIMAEQPTTRVETGRTHGFEEGRCPSYRLRL
jgi:hypothetical protein